MTQLVKLVDKDIKMFIKIVFYIFKKLDEKLNMLNKDTLRNVLKD